MTAVLELATGMYRQAPARQCDWYLFLAPEARRVIYPPAWATELWLQGWYVPGTFEWLRDDDPADGVLELHYRRPHPRPVEGLAMVDGEHHPVTLYALEVGYLTRRGGQVTYRHDPLKVVIEVGGTEIELEAGTAVSIGEVLRSPIRYGRGRLA